METINLEKELRTADDGMLKEVQEFNSLKEVKLLLDNNQSEHKRVLQNFRLDDSIKRVEEATGRMIEFEDFTKHYGNAYSRQAIRVIAMDYRLKFLPLNLYKGAVDPYLAAKMLEFGKKHNVDVTTPAAQDEFYVLAPAEDFRLTTEVHTTIIRKIVSQDPLLFYRGMTRDNNNTNGDLWSLVHKWGTEFTILRYLRALPFRTAKHLWIANAMAYAAILLVVACVLFPTYSYSMIWLLVIASVGGCLGSCIRSGQIDASQNMNMFTENSWSDSRFHVSETKVEIEYR